MSSHQQQPNFWDFVNSFDPTRATGQGVDHNQSHPFGAFFPFGGPGARRPHPSGPWSWGGDTADFDEWNPWVHHGGPWGRRGGRHSQHRGHHNAHEGAARQHDREASSNERDDSPETMTAEDTAAAPDPAEVTPEDINEPGPRERHGRRGGFGRCGRGGGPFRRGPHHGPPHGHPHGHHHGPGPQHFRGGPPHPPPYPGFDFQGLISALGSHPIVQNLRDYIPDAQNDGNTREAGEGNDANAFTPPVDVFNTSTAYVLHVALPGARKEDVGVTWDADARQVRVAGVVHRPGDEEFLATLQGSGERRVGLFERHVSLPGQGQDADEVEAMNISAKMEDGVLVVTVPKVPKDEKEWTEIHKVDIE